MYQTDDMRRTKRNRILAVVLAALFVGAIVLAAIFAPSAKKPDSDAIKDNSAKTSANNAANGRAGSSSNSGSNSGSSSDDSQSQADSASDADFPLSAKVTNFASCVTRSVDVSTLGANVALFVTTYLKAANQYNGQPTAATYDMQIRDGSCQQSITPGGGDFANAIVDVPDAKQSWGVRYTWVDAGASSQLGNPGDFHISCLPTSQLIYGDFHCQSALDSIGIK